MDLAGGVDGGGPQTDSPAVCSADYSAGDANEGVVSVRERTLAQPSSIPLPPPIDVRHDTIPAPGKWSSDGSVVLAVPYLKLAQVLLLAGSMAIKGASSIEDVDLHEIDAYLAGVYSGRLSTDRVVADAKEATSGQAKGWRRHTRLVVGFSVLSVSIDAVRKGMTRLNCAACDFANCEKRIQPTEVGA